MHLKGLPIGGGKNGQHLTRAELKTIRRHIRDAELSTKVEMQWLYSGSGMIGKLFNALGNYATNTSGKFSDMPELDYSFFPSAASGTYHSDSYARGILEAVGLKPVQPSYSVPGWNRPVPADYFKHWITRGK